MPDPNDRPLKDSGERQAFSTGAQRDAQSGKGRYDLLPVLALRRLAVTFEKGAEKYAARNWEKGIPLSKYMDSAIRHLFKHLEGWTDEDHAAQALWNVACMIQTAEMVERGLLPAELADLPSYLPPGADSWEPGAAERAEAEMMAELATEPGIIVPYVIDRPPHSF